MSHQQSLQLEISKTAKLLHEWFQRVIHSTDQMLFGIAPKGPHREAVVLDVLSKNARKLRTASLDTNGELYTSLLLLLAAIYRRLALTLNESHWEAALTNVLTLGESIIEYRAEANSLGLEFGTSAALFKGVFDDALGNSGLAGVDSGLGEEDQRMALGLALNWGMRFLLAYAVECGESLPEQVPGKKDLSWIRDVVSSFRGLGIHI
jgi:hypothetical protein